MVSGFRTLRYGVDGVVPRDETKRRMLA
jgi:hypothetical protein